MPGKPFVDIRVVGREEIHDAAILAKLAFDEQLGFSRQGHAQAFVELWLCNGVREGLTNISQHQPLSGEVVHQGLGAGIGQHPTDLLLQHNGVS